MVRRLFAVALILAAVLLSTGCGGNGNALPDETSDPLYQQAQDLKNQGRNNEALSAFLKVIERRGEAGAPESHIEAGSLYLTHARDPFEAYHHFSKYLELQPNGPRAKMVHGQRDAAMREVARMLQAPPGDQSVRLGQNEEIDQLRRRVQELEAELQTLRGSSAGVTHTAPMIALPDDTRSALAANDSSAEPLITPVQKVATPPPDATFGRAMISPASPPPPRGGPAAATTTANTAERVATTPMRPGAPQRNVPAPPAVGRRTHTVTAGEKSLWGIARQYYGKPSAAQVQGIYQANRDVMKSDSDLRAGMVLRIP